MGVSTFIVLLFGMLNACTNPAQAQSSPTFVSEGQKFRVETLLQREDVILGFDFLSDGKIIFTEREGALLIYEPKTKSVRNVTGAPLVWAKGQGGLLDVRVHPQTGRIYLSYSEPLGALGATTAVGFAELRDHELKNWQKFFSAHQGNSNKIHFGSRIEFDEKGHIFVTVGDRNERTHVQDLSFHQGKILRFNENGTVPKDNPFANRSGAKAEIWSYGHRSPQGLAKRPGTEELWMAEMGPRGGDEINLVKAGLNYGWPDVTYGREYYGPRIGVTEKAGTEPPKVHWVPSISPSGIAFYSGSAFPQWRGNLFVATLSGTHLRRLVLEGDKVVKQEDLLSSMTRFRNVRPGSDGFLYLSTDDGRIMRLVPAP